MQNTVTSVVLLLNPLLWFNILFSPELPLVLLHAITRHKDTFSFAMSLSQIETLGSMEISLQSVKLNTVHWETQCECLIFAVPNTTDFWSSLLLPSMALCRGLHSTSSAYCNTLQEFNKTSFRIHARAKFNGPSAECHTRLLEAPFYLYQSDSEGKTTNKSELVKSNFSHFLAFLVFPRSLQHLKL